MKAKQIGYYLIPNIKISKTKYIRWRKISKKLNLSKKANQRLDWIIYYYAKSNKNASLTCRHFGITRSKWYFWFKRFDESNLRTLEDDSTSPNKKRQPEYTGLQYERVVRIRKKRIRYGKVKILKIYKDIHPEDKNISEWKVQYIIQVSKLYYHPKKAFRTANKRKKAINKKRIAELKKKPKNGYLLALDSVVRIINGQRRYIITAIDTYSKVAYARMYSSHGSACTEDFLIRLNYLLDGKIDNILTDNGSEFQKHFERACQKLGLDRYYSRIRQPKDNPVCERFNRTLNEEFIQLGNSTSNITIFNSNLTEWLAEYNFYRPHQTLEYMTPIGFTQKWGKVSKMYSSNTGYLTRK